MSHLRTLLPATLSILACACPVAVASAAPRHHAHRAHHRLQRHHPHHSRRTVGSRVAGRRSHAARKHHSPEMVLVSATPTARSHGNADAAAIASVLATPCRNTELTPEPGNLAEVSAATLCLIDQERARDGELPLQPNAQLGQAARSHAEKMVAEDYFAHVSPNGETPLDRIEAGGYVPNAQVGYTVGENIAWGTLSLATPSAIVAAWIASPEHLANILNGSYRDTGIGVVPAVPASLSGGQAGAVYTQEFGVIVG